MEINNSEVKNITNANPQVSKKTTMEEAFDKVKEFSKDIQEEFENMQEVESSNVEKVDSREAFGATISSVISLINSPFEPIKYVLDRFFPQGELSLIYGDSSCGKSMFLRCLGFAIAYGCDEFLGIKIGLEEDERKVALAITEDSEHNTKILLQKQNGFFEPLRKIENPVFDVISCCENGVVDTLHKIMPIKKYNLIILDTPQDDISITYKLDKAHKPSYLCQIKLTRTLTRCT